MGLLISFAKFWLLGSTISMAIIFVLSVNILIQKWLLWLKVSSNEWMNAYIAALQESRKIKILTANEMSDGAGYTHIVAIYKSLDPNNPKEGMCELVRFQYPQYIIYDFVTVTAQAFVFSLLTSWWYLGLILQGLISPPVVSRSEEMVEPRTSSSDQPAPKDPDKK